MDEKYQNYIIKAIAQESGIFSMSVFYNAFKKITGSSPKEYVNKVKNKK
jgi:AraC-like DNA-binding protein